MKFQAISTPSLKELFVNTIQTAILNGELKVGEKLPSEREFSEQMEVSRAVVNAGLTELMDRGFVVIEPRKGAFVADYRRNGNLETLNAILNFMDFDLTDDSVRSLLEYKKLTDHLASERIINTATEEELNRLGEKMKKLRAASGIENTVDCAFDYYHEFCSISHDLILPLIMMSFERCIRNLWTRYCVNYGTEALIHSLSTMYEYVSKRDSAGAHSWAEEDMNRSISGDRPVFH